jgi:hypothetical protein
MTDVRDWAATARKASDLNDALNAPNHYESNGEAGDGQMVCDVCGLDADTPHRYPDRG